MGIELPAELADVAAKAGVSWPQADEDALRASATAWREAGSKLAALAGESDGSASKALTALSGSTGDAARGHWNKFTAPDGTLNSVLRGCTAAADRLDHAAEQIGAAKVELVRELVNLAKNSDAAQQAANAGHPTALLGLDAVLRGAAANVAHLTDTLTSAVRLDSGVRIGDLQLPVNANPGVQGPGDVGPGQGQGPGQGSGAGQPQGGGLPGGVPGQGGGLVDGLLGGGPGNSGNGGGSADNSGNGGPAGGQPPGSVGGLVGAVTDTAGAVAQPVVQTVGAVAPPVAAVVEPVLDKTGEVARDVGGAVDDTVGRTVQGAADTVQGVTDTATPGRDNGSGRDNGPGHGNGSGHGNGNGPGHDSGPGHGNGPGQHGGSPGPGNRLGDVVNPVLGAVPAVAGPVVDAVTRTEGTVNQSSAAVLDRPLVHTEAPHATAQPAAPAANQAVPQGPTFNGPSAGGGPAGAPAAAAAAAVAQGSAANAAAGAAANTQAPGQQSGQQAAQKVEARAAQAAQPGQLQPGQPQPGQVPAGPGQPAGQGQPGAGQTGQGQSGQGQQGQGQSGQGGQGQGGQAKDAGAAQAKGETAAKAEGPAKADGQAKGDSAVKGELKDVQPRDLKDALAAAVQQVKDGELGFAIIPLPTGGRDSTGSALLPGATSAVLSADPADTPPAPPVKAAQTAQPTTEAAALFLLHVFPGGTLPPPSAEPARQLPPPSEDEAFAAGLRFEPQGHPDGDLVDASAQYGLDLRGAGQDGLRSRLSGAEPTGARTGPVSTDPVPARNRPHLPRTPGAAPDPELVDGYDPLAGMHERDWDRRFLVRADPPEYAWPPGELFPEGGYEAGQAGVLAVGVELDRFGSPDGRVLSQLGTAYAERSLPPALVDAGYHRYRVAKVLPVWFTLSAEWFGQPGGGVRYRTTYPVADLLALGYLEELG